MIGNQDSTKGHNVLGKISEMFPEALNLVNQSLRYDPSTRMTAEEALCHNIFKKFHDPADEPKCINIPDFDWEKDEKIVQSKSSLKLTIYKTLTV